MKSWVRKLGKKGMKLCLVLPLIFSMNWMGYAMPHTEPGPISMPELERYYSDSELQTLIREIAEAAHQAIEVAAGEAARVATLAGLEREATAQVKAKESLLRMIELEGTLVEERAAFRRKTIKVSLLTFLGGFAVGLVGMAMTTGGR